MGAPYDEHNETSSQPGVVPDSGRQARENWRDDLLWRKQWSTRSLLTMMLTGLIIFCLGLLIGWQLGLRSVVISPSLLNRDASSLEGAIEAQRSELITEVRPAVVQINTTGTKGSSNGSGVIVNKQGYIVTNAHVIAGEKRMQVVLYNGRIFDARLVGTAMADDLAVIKIAPLQEALHAVTFGDSSALHVGQSVMVIGSPLGIDQTVTSGIVSALGRNVATGQRGQILPNTIQTDAAINPGNSGGALIDMHGAVIGIPTLSVIDPEYKTPANGVGFAVPSNRINFIVPQLMKSGRVEHTGRAALEAQVVDVDPIIASQEHLATTEGALIVSVIQGGAADRAHLQRGDIIVAVDNKPVNNVLSLSDTLLNKDPGDKALVQFYRGNQQQSAQVKLGELPPL